MIGNLPSGRPPEPAPDEREDATPRRKEYRKVRAEDEERGQQTDPNKTNDRDD